MITQIIANATFFGMIIILGNRLVLGSFRLILPICIVIITIVGSLILLRKRFLRLAVGLLLCTLLAFCNYLILLNDGLHDSAILIIPGVLVIAGAIMDRKNYFTYMTVSMSSIVIIGYMEIVGIIQNEFSKKTNVLDIIDIVVILSVTAFTIRLLSDNLLRSLAKASKNEKRYRTLYEAANDAIFIMRKDRIIECNEMSLSIFGCEDYTDLVGYTPWEFSPLIQPDGMNSKEKALEIIQKVLMGKPQRFYWKHSKKNGSLFDAEISLNSLELKDEKLIQAIVRDVTERKVMEERIRESEEYYRTLVETSPDAIISVDTGGQLLFVSSRARSMFEAPQEFQIAGKSFIEWVAPDDRKIVANRFSEVVSGRVQPIKQEFRFLKFNNSVFWGELMSSRVVDADGRTTGLLAICRDVTERKLAEEKLHESVERMRVIVEGTPDLFFYTQDAEANSTYVSPTVEMITGYSTEEWLKRSDWFITDAEINQMAKEKTHSRLRGEVTKEPILVEVKHADGRRIMLEVYENPVFKGGGVVGLQGVARDITKRIEAEQALKMSEEKFSKLFYANPAAIILVRLSDNKVLEINDSFTKMTGYDRIEAIGKKALDLNLWVNLEERKEVVAELEQKATVKNRESQFRRKDGSIIISNYSADILSIDREPYVMLSAVDITLRRQAEENLRISRDQLRTLAVKIDMIREEERKRIAREIHDQLGQILTGLKMNVSWISKKVSAENSLKQKTDYMIELIDMAIQSVRKIATDLRPGVLDELGLEAAIEWQALEFEKQSGIPCQLDIRKQPELANQEFSIAVFRILQEALTNIARHSSASEVMINLAVENNSLYLTIEDNGKGITEEQIKDHNSIGILGMNERAMPFGGEVIVSPGKERGTKVIARIPLKKP